MEGVPKLLNEMLSLQGRVGKLLKRCKVAGVEKPLVYPHACMLECVSMRTRVQTQIVCDATQGCPEAQGANGGAHETA